MAYNTSGDGPICEVDGERSTDCAGLAIYANYVGHSFPDGFGADLDLNEAPVMIDDSTWTTPFVISVNRGTTLTVDVPGMARVCRDGLVFGKAVFERWSDGQDKCHQFTVEEDDTLILYYDPYALFVYEEDGGEGLKNTVEGWADDADSVIVGSGSYIVDLHDPISIERSIIIVSKDWSAQPVISGVGSPPWWNPHILDCYGSSGVQIGNTGYGRGGFRFDTSDPATGTGWPDCVQAVSCIGLVVKGNRFTAFLDDGGGYFCGGGLGLEVYQCTDVLIEGNDFDRGQIGCYLHWSDSVEVVWNEFWNLIHERTMCCGLVPYNCTDVGIYRNKFRYFRETDNYGPAVGIDHGVENVVIGGSFENRNQFHESSHCVCLNQPQQTDQRINAEFNYWSGFGYDQIPELISDDLNRQLDFVPWMDGWGEALVPFDPDSSKVAIAGPVSVCPGGDMDQIEIEIQFLDSGGEPVQHMWCDDVVLSWLREGFGDPTPCAVEESFDDLKTDTGGRVTVDWARAGGCDDLLAVSVEGVEITDGVPAIVNSPDFDANGVVDIHDFGTFAGLYRSSEMCADYNFDGAVTHSDFAQFSAHYLHGCTSGPPGLVVASDIGASGQVALPQLGGPDSPSGTSKTVDFALVVQDGAPKNVVAIELAVSYDMSSGMPQTWESGRGLQFIRLEPGAEANSEGVGGVRVVCEVDGSCPDGSTAWAAGTLRFVLSGEESAFKPQIRELMGVSQDGEIVDLVRYATLLSSRPSDSTGGSVNSPVLEVEGNPAKDLVSITFGAPLAEYRQLRVEIFDVRGRLITCPYDGGNVGSLQTVQVKSDNDVRLSPGVYFVRLSGNGKSLDTEKLLLLR